MATETTAVLEWNFENVLIWVSELCQESVVCSEEGPVF